jgi:hypothetical protein
VITEQKTRTSENLVLMAFEFRRDFVLREALLTEIQVRRPRQRRQGTCKAFTISPAFADHLWSSEALMHLLGLFTVFVYWPALLTTVPVFAERQFRWWRQGTFKSFHPFNLLLAVRSRDDD